MIATKLNLNCMLLILSIELQELLLMDEE